MKYIITFTLLVVIFLLPSCGKKWKKPTHISCFFLLNNSSPGLVNITSGNIVISEIDFNGKRKQGTTNVSFQKNFDNGLNIPLSLSKSVSDIIFDIPQGTYTTADFNIKIKDLNNNPSLTLTGTYINTLSVSVPLIFTMDADETIEPTSKSANGGTEIILIENKPPQLNINLNPNYWFQSISQYMLESAELTDVDSVMTIQINKDKNPEIYNLIVGRIKNGSEAVFQ